MSGRENFDLSEDSGATAEWRPNKNELLINDSDGDIVVLNGCEIDALVKALAEIRKAPPKPAPRLVLADGGFFELATCGCPALYFDTDEYGGAAPCRWFIRSSDALKLAAFIKENFPEQLEENDDLPF